jgi:hypothetical protein
MTFLTGFVIAACAGVLGLRACLLDWRYRRLIARRPAADDRRRWLLGRMAVMGSVVFAILLAAARLWDTYDEVLLGMPAIRTMILRADRATRTDWTVRRNPQDPQFSKLVELLRKGTEYQANRHYRSLSRLQAELLERIDQYRKATPSRSLSRSDIANQINNLAWSMATTPDPDGIDGRHAAALAAKATELMPGEGNIWNTLGVAHYRAGDANAARSALQQSMDLRDGGDSFDWFFLAMIHQDAEQPETARRWYDRAVTWMKAYRPGDVELLRFRAEAATSLNLDDPEAQSSLPDPPVRSRFRGGPRSRFQR